MKSPLICENPSSSFLRNAALLLVALTFFAVASAGQAQSLGESVATDGGYIVAGAPDDSSQAASSGVVKIFDSSSGALLYTIPNPSPAQSDFFGVSVAISGTLVVVGASGDDTGATDTGSAYVYDLSSGTPTVPVATLNNPSPAATDSFGSSVAISGTVVVVGASLHDTGATNAGSAYVYDLSSGTPTVPVTTLNNPSPTVGGNFGISVSISGTRVAVGAAEPAGSGHAYVYDVSSGTPSVPVTTLNNPAPAPGDQFGFSVAISGTRMVVGAPADDAGATNAGSAYVYDLNSGTPTVPVATLSNPSPAASDTFGFAVSISGLRVLVGSRLHDTGATDAGSAYVYDLSSGTPTVPVATLNNPTPATNDQFGHAVAILGPRVVVGAPGDDTVGTDAGNVYVYDLSNGSPTVPVATLNRLPQVLNISTRLRVDVGDRVGISGFIIRGNVSKPVLLRGMGPSLVKSGLPAASVLADPFLELHGPDGTFITSNDNWKNSPQRSQIEGTIFQPTDDREAVILTTLAPGAYTVLMGGVARTSGIGLIEVYDAAQQLDSDLANISTRGFVGTGDNVMIGGFTLSGNNSPPRIAVRALGPSLANSGLSNVLADPTLELRDSNGAILVTNDDWQSDPVSAGQLTANGLAPSNAKEAAIFMSATPAGQFTAIVAGKNGGVGIGLIEIYNLK